MYMYVVYSVGVGRISSVISDDPTFNKKRDMIDTQQYPMSDHRGRRIPYFSH